MIHWKKGNMRQTGLNLYSYINWTRNTPCQITHNIVKQGTHHTGFTGFTTIELLLTCSPSYSGNKATNVQLF